MKDITYMFSFRYVQVLLASGLQMASVSLPETFAPASDLRIFLFGVETRMPQAIAQ